MLDTNGITSKQQEVLVFAMVDGYLFPCVPSSCPTPEAQVNATVSALRSNAVEIITGRRRYRAIELVQ